MNDAMRNVSPDDFLPLTPVAFDILLALGQGDAHGYAILQDIAERSGRSRPHAGTLYRAIARMVDAGLLQELESDGAESGDERRRYYRMTGLGRRVAEAEAARLSEQLTAARARRLVRGAWREG
jgi:DNA-binding PadR family transcriptional regulator